MGKTIRIEGGIISTSQNAKDELIKFAEENDMSLYAAASTLIKEGIYHREGKCKMSDPTFVPDDPKDVMKMAEETHDRAMSELRKFNILADRMGKKPAAKLLVKMVDKSKRASKAAKDSGLYGASRWKFFLENTIDLKAPPYEVASQALKEHMEMALAAVSQGYRTSDLDSELDKLHREHARTYRKNGSRRVNLAYKDTKLPKEAKELVDEVMNK